MATKRKKAPPDLSQFPKLFTVQETADILRVSRTTVWRWINEGFIKATKLPKNKSIRIPESEILKIIEEGKNIK